LGEGRWGKKKPHPPPPPPPLKQFSQRENKRVRSRKGKKKSPHEGGTSKRTCWNSAISPSSKEEGTKMPSKGRTNVLLSNGWKKKLKREWATPSAQRNGEGLREGVGKEKKR